MRASSGACSSTGDPCLHAHRKALVLRYTPGNWAQELPGHLSATRIIRSLFFPSSLGLTDGDCMGKNICHAAFSFLMNSPMGLLSLSEPPAFTCSG